MVKCFETKKQLSTLFLDQSDLDKTQSVLILSQLGARKPYLIKLCCGTQLHVPGTFELGKELHQH